MQPTDCVAACLLDFTRWLNAYGETSWDHQSFFAGPVGGAAKSLYYKNKTLGTATVAPMIFVEAFLPSARRLFHHRTRFAIADAHYALGFAFLYELTLATANPRTQAGRLSSGGSDLGHFQRATHFLDELKKSRSPGFEEYCWGYPFD